MVTLADLDWSLLMQTELVDENS
jgi:hypothetical protein